MLILENILLALDALRSNKSRAFLTMLGIIIGIASVIAIMTLGNTLSTSVSDSMSGMGASNVTIGLQSKSQSDEVEADGTEFKSVSVSRNITDSDRITDDMLEEMTTYFGSRIKYLLLTESVGTGKAGDQVNYAKVTITGVNAGDLEYEDLTLLAGRLFNEEEQQNGSRVALVSDRYVKYMYGGDYEKALGSQAEIRVSGKYYTYTIVGVYEYEDLTAGFDTGESEQDETTTLYIPVKTAQTQNHTSGYTQFQAAIADGESGSQMVSDIENFFNTHYYRNNRGFQVSAYSMEEMLETMTSMLNTVSLVIAAIAGISLLVGGIGVMNIMLVSITERTKEIGTRKALGATNGSIRLQFIMESVVICLVGGLIGILLGVIMGYVGASMMGYTGHVSVISIVISVGFSAFIGIFFGYYPANKAAKMNPIDALRYE